MGEYVRPLARGMGEALAARSFFRENENWKQLSERVAFGNVSINQKYGWQFMSDGNAQKVSLEEHELSKLIAKGICLMSGRHLQQGDAKQKMRNIEIFTNCSTAATSYQKFYLLLNGSGVGRCYDDDLMIVNWCKMPNIVCVLDEQHKDYKDGILTPYNAIKNLRENGQEKFTYIMVGDSREGWAKIVEQIEAAAFHGYHKNKTYIIDFSLVRPFGSPICGMQDKPSSGPLPFMKALENIAKIKQVKYKPWLQTMFIDHYLADCVVVGGARRSSRIAVKHWKDLDILSFISLKSDLPELYSSNNSIAVDQEFWDNVDNDGWAKIVFNHLIEYGYKTGEPGIVNVHKLASNLDGIEEYLINKDVIGNSRYKLSKNAQKLSQKLIDILLNKSYQYITNPCGEISLLSIGGYCVIGDIVPYFADNIKEVKQGFRLLTRALIRTNLLEAFFTYEVKRTNRIGVSMTGIHEFALKYFGYAFFDLIDENKSQDFWDTLKEFRQVVEDEAEKYSKELGLNTPHTITTIKPAGSTSKLFGLSEGAHLPPRREYIRWVQFTPDDILIDKYKTLGYPIKKLKKYNAIVIGFPTQPEICKIDRSKTVIAEEATPEQQYKWLMLLEKYWIGENNGNQISYTLKFDPKKIPKEEYTNLLKKYQSKIKACSVMPAQDVELIKELYEYLPEEKVDYEKFVSILYNITDNNLLEAIDVSHMLKCDSGGCPEL